MFRSIDVGSCKRVWIESGPGYDIKGRQTAVSSRVLNDRFNCHQRSEEDPSSTTEDDLTRAVQNNAYITAAALINRWASCKMGYVASLICSQKAAVV